MSCHWTKGQSQTTYPIAPPSSTENHVLDGFRGSGAHERCRNACPDEQTDQENRNDVHVGHVMGEV